MGIHAYIASDGEVSVVRGDPGKEAFGLRPRDRDRSARRGHSAAGGGAKVRSRLAPTGGTRSAFCSTVAAGS